MKSRVLDRRQHDSDPPTLYQICVPYRRYLPGGVIVEPSLRVKGLGAGQAGEHPVVLPNMGLQVVRRREPLAALLKAAGEVFFGAAVATPVARQLVTGDKAPAAAGKVALERLLVVVLEDVEAELEALDVGLATPGDGTAPVLLTTALHADLAKQTEL